MGRFPNGTGNFYHLIPSFSSQNNVRDPAGINKTIQSPDQFELFQNYPNPFNPLTAIGYRLSAVSDVELSIYNNLGQKVVTLVSDRQSAGVHKVEWDAGHLASGVYYYQIIAGDFRSVKKMILIR
jgi:hypothetical protein